MKRTALPSSTLALATARPPSSPSRNDSLARLPPPTKAVLPDQRSPSRRRTQHRAPLALRPFPRSMYPPCRISPSFASSSCFSPSSSAATCTRLRLVRRCVQTTPLPLLRTLSSPPVRSTSKAPPLLPDAEPRNDDPFRAAHVMPCVESVCLRDMRARIGRRVDDERSSSSAGSLPLTSIAHLSTRGLQPPPRGRAAHRSTAGQHRPGPAAVPALPIRPRDQPGGSAGSARRGRGRRCCCRP